MQKRFLLITPQKKDNLELKEFSPLPSIISHHHRTTKLEILQSPMTPNKDLFNQLLSIDQTKSPGVQSSASISYELHYQIMEQQSEELVSSSQSHDQDQNQDGLSLEDNDDDQAGLRKRKRKSTAQIKVLKAELDQESNWTKEKIVQMSDLTGLSQSQVYKWWWDQKKKNMKNEHNLAEKRKMIRKDTFRKGIAYDKSTHGFYIDESMLTKPKTAIDIEQMPETERKINKRLVFM